MPFTTITRGLTLKVPTRGTRGWTTTFLEEFANSISEHGHTGDGDGNKITESALADNAVTSDKIDDDAVIEEKILDSAVTTSKINNLAVTEAKLAGSAVAASKLKQEAVALANYTPTLSIASGGGSGLTYSVSAQKAEWGMFYILKVNLTAIEFTGNVTTFELTLPTGWSLSPSVYTYLPFTYYTEAGAPGDGTFNINITGSKLTLFRNDAANWTDADIQTLSIDIVIPRLTAPA